MFCFKSQALARCLLNSGAKHRVFDTIDACSVVNLIEMIQTILRILSPSKSLGVLIGRALLVIWRKPFSQVESTSSPALRANVRRPRGDKPIEHGGAGELHGYQRARPMGIKGPGLACRCKQPAGGPLGTAPQGQLAVMSIAYLAPTEHPSANVRNRNACVTILFA